MVRISQKQAWWPLSYFRQMKSRYFREYFCSFSRKSHYFYILNVSHLNWSSDSHSVDSLWPCDAIWHMSELTKVMACCLTAPSHYLSQCCLITREVLWYSSELGQFQCSGYLSLIWVWKVLIYICYSFLLIGQLRFNKKIFQHIPELTYSIDSVPKRTILLQVFRSITISSSNHIVRLPEVHCNILSPTESIEIRGPFYKHGSTGKHNINTCGLV